MDEIRLLVVDDRDIVRDGLKLVLSDTMIVVKGEATDGYEAIDLVMKNDYDVVLMDVNMPNMNGIDATRELKKIDPDIKILATSFWESPEFIKEMITAGASGFIKKGESKNVYEEAIELINNGMIYLSEEVSGKTYEKVFSYLKHPFPSMV